MKKALRYSLIIVATIIAFNLTAVPWFAPGMIFFPDREVSPHPTVPGHASEDLYLTSKNGKKINGWFFGSDRTRKVILYLHGNAGNIGNPLTRSAITAFTSLPANVFAIDYQGYGKSEGTPSENKAYQDAEAAYAFLKGKKGFAPRDIIVAGNSLGGAAATYLATHYETGGLVLQRTFTSIPAMARRRNPWLRPPLFWININFDNLRMIKKVTVPVLIIHSKQDEVIPYQMAQEIYRDCPQPKKLILLESGRHDDDLFAPGYISSLKELLAK